MPSEKTKEMIHLKHEQDIAFSNIAQNARVTGAILPSGLQVPKSGDWVIQNNSVVLLKKNETEPNMAQKILQQTNTTKGSDPSSQK